ncbi:MAG: bifunctional demethylmenaquinone methyltransferase/2-methoxy-6-polyprenyl-1,4-benzoquinol methylase UbiE [Bacteroidales bacterium]|nr:bifunctional demethylmenaquinone methyltransferase/2-methoxy-6-polyprenyl-1,4-benzoquinol methylase UbiE [Bacteroidales bacterium]
MKTDKKQQVKEMFNQIAGKYDFLNHFLSFGVDLYWRNRAIKLIKKILKHNCINQNDLHILDIATGTADLAIALNKLKPKKIIGIDISENMLQLGQKKISDKKIKNIELQLGDVENLKFENNSFNMATVAFGLRNFDNVNKSLSEVYRILTNNGFFLILEFTKPSLPIFKSIYQFYFNYILPRLGKIISKNNYAYSYLPHSVKEFPQKEKLMDELKITGFDKIIMYQLTLGIVSIYFAFKSNKN